MMNYAETLDAITDKICIDNCFYGKILSPETSIMTVLEEYGLELDGVAKEVFIKAIEEIRRLTKDELEKLHKKEIL